MLFVMGVCMVQGAVRLYAYECIEILTFLDIVVEARANLSANGELANNCMQQF